MSKGFFIGVTSTKGIRRCHKCGSIIGSKYYHIQVGSEAYGNICFRCIGSMFRECIDEIPDAASIIQHLFDIHSPETWIAIILKHVKRKEKQ